MDPLQFFWPRIEAGLGFVVEARPLPTPLDGVVAQFGDDPEDWPAEWVRQERYIVTGTAPRRLGETTQIPADAAPLEQTPALWLALANVIDETGLVSFVAKYGPLRWPLRLLDWKPSPDDPNGYTGEAVADDLNAAKEIRRVRDLWRALRSNDTEALDAFLEELVPAFHLPVGKKRADIARQQAGQFVAQAINKGTTRVRLNVEYVEPFGADRAFWHSLIPDDLVAAAWAQVARAIGGNVDLAVCRREGCGAWYEVHPSQTRRDRLYCSNACKQASYRARKAGEQGGASQ